MTLEDWIHGRAVADVATVAVANAEIDQSAAATEGLSGTAALSVLNSSGARLLPHRHKAIAVSKHRDTADLRQALAALGYGSYRVIHVDTGRFEGKGISVLEAALDGAGILS